MGYLITGLVMLGIIFLFAFTFIKASPAAIAGVLRLLGPLLTIVLSIALTAAGRGAFGIPLAVLGGIWWYKNYKSKKNALAGNSNIPTIRSALLEIKLEAESGKLDGTILAGDHEGQILSEISAEELSRLRATIQEDGESSALLEAYLDSSVPGWREDTNAGDSSGKRSPSGSGPMSKQEAYQVLGLRPSAGSAEIAAAHRKLQKVFHPDTGGSAFIASRINDAKETLLD